MSIIKGEKAKVVTLFGTITVPSGARSFAAYLARPDLRGEWPTVLLLTGVPQVTSPVKEVCRRLARQGLAVIAPGESGSAAAREATIDFVVNPTADWSNAEHGYGVLGLEAGGGAAVEESASSRLVSALALLSAPPDPVALLQVSGCPTIGLSGREDAAVPGDSIVEARAAAPQTEWVVYNGLGGDFWNDGAVGWDQDASDDAIDRLSSFFERHLPRLIA